MSHIDIFWILLSSFLVFIMQAGFTCLEAGLTRNKNNINVAIKNLSIFGTSFIVFYFIGSLITFNNAFFNTYSNTEETVLLIFASMFCSNTMTIISGAVSERFRFKPFLISIPLLALCIYAVVYRLVWQDGLLNEMGFLDFAGGTVVHAVGGWISLAAVIKIGARKGRFENGQTRNIQGSNLPLSVIGVFLLWFGWFGFNGGSTFSFNENVPLIIANTLIGGSFGGFGALLFSLYRNNDKKIKIEDLLKGTLGGLVCITGGCLYITTNGAIILGFLGAVFTLIIDELLLKFQIDDAVSAIPVHLGSSILGAVLWPIFSRDLMFLKNQSFIQQIGLQFIGVLVVGLYSFTLAWIIFTIINKLSPIRIKNSEEDEGLNILEHGASTAERDLLDVIRHQRKSGDLSLRAPVESFTDIGKIAVHYNELLNRIENDFQNIQNHSDKMTKVATVSAEIIHDIKTPLQTIYGSLFILKSADNPGREFINSKVASIESAIDRIKESLNVYLYNVREELEEYQQLPVKKFSQELQSIFFYRFKHLNIRFEIIFNKDINFSVKPFHFIRVFQNLIENSIKAISILPDKEIKIEIHEEENFIIFNYSDSGENAHQLINQALTKPIFSYSIAKSNSDFINAGLGMRIISKIIEQHKGFIEAIPNNPNTLVRIAIPKN